MSELYIMNMEEVNIFVIAREQCDRGDPVSNKVARIRVRALFTGLLRFTRNDKCVDCVAVRNDRLWIAPRMTRRGGGRRGKLKQGD